MESDNRYDSVDERKYPPATYLTIILYYRYDRFNWISIACVYKSYENKLENKIFRFRSCHTYLYAIKRNLQRAVSIGTFWSFVGTESSISARMATLLIVTSPTYESPDTGIETHEIPTRITNRPSAFVLVYK